MVRLPARFKEGDETDIERDRMESETILLLEKRASIYRDNRTRLGEKYVQTLGGYPKTRTLWHDLRIQDYSSPLRCRQTWDR